MYSNTLWKYEKKNHSATTKHLDQNMCYTNERQIRLTNLNVMRKGRLIDKGCVHYLLRAANMRKPITVFQQ